MGVATTNSVVTTLIVLLLNRLCYELYPIALVYMIYFKNISKAFGPKKVLQNLDLHIKRGKITFIVGKSGEGKSVTIKHIMGLMSPDEGEVWVDGQDISGLDDRELLLFRRNFGMLFQHAALFDSLSVQENVIFSSERAGRYEASTDARTSGGGPRSGRTHGW